MNNKLAKKQELANRIIMLKILQTKSQPISKGGENLNTKEQILELYFEHNLTQSDIANELNLTKQYISKIVTKDKRYSDTKEARKQRNLNKRKEYLKDYYKSYIRIKKYDTTYQKLQVQLEQDTRELSSPRNYLSNYAYSKFNPSIYHRDKNGNLKIDKNENVGADVPKIINKKFTVPTQKYKQKHYVR